MWTIKVDTPFLIILTIGLLYFRQEAASGLAIGIIAYGYMRKCFIEYRDKHDVKKLAANYIKAINTQLADNLKVDPKEGVKFKAVINDLSDIEAAQQYKAFMLYLIHEATKRNFKIN